MKEKKYHKKYHKKSHKNKIKDRKRKQFQERENKIQKYKALIKKYNNDIWCPDKDAIYNNINSNSWFDIQNSPSQIDRKYDINLKSVFSKNLKKCIKVQMKPTYKQKRILDRWFDAYALMYNETLSFIKRKYREEGELYINAHYNRTHHLKEIRDNIIKNSPLQENKKDIVKCHILDYAIKLACANYKSALTNFRLGYIKKFRIRYWRHNRNNKVMDIEQQYFKINGLCPQLFGNIKCFYNNEIFDLGLINTQFKVDSKTNEYILLVPEDIMSENNHNINNVISLDPGIRPFMTGISENESIKIGDKCSDKIKSYLKLIDKRNAMNISKKKQRKNEKTCFKKIKGLVDELHWKTINFLTNRYKNILIGNMSVKGITSNMTSNLQHITKRIAYCLSFYKFRQRLEYKCNLKRIHYRLVDECYTSKICSLCGWINEQLGSSKVFSCNNCNIVIDRDINGARGIFIKGKIM